MTTFMLTFRNLAVWEQVVRIAVGLILLILGWTPWSAPWMSVLRVLALYPLITGTVGWCPIYALLRLDSRSQVRRRTRPAHDSKDDLP
jgi:Inner membrane protein YgaP-like, transmembrane domain